MKQKEIIYNIALEEVLKLKLDNYHTIFLANMVLRKVRHPEEKMDKIAAKTMKKMLFIYEKKNLVEISSDKCLDNLEEALNRSNSVPQEWLVGQEVSNVVKHLALMVIDKADAI